MSLFRSDPEDAVDGLTQSILDYLTRSYEEYVAWTTKAKDVFLSVNGDSAVARCRVAYIVRQSISKRLEAGESVIGLSKSKLQKLGYVDWLFVADYLLIPLASSENEDIKNENAQRKVEYGAIYDSYELRNRLYEARKLIRSHPNATNKEVLALLKETFPDASLANVSEARQQEKKGAGLERPVPPDKPKDLPPYESVFFPKVAAGSRDR